MGSREEHLFGEGSGVIGRSFALVDPVNRRIAKGQNPTKRTARPGGRKPEVIESKHSRSDRDRWLLCASPD